MGRYITAIVLVLCLGSVVCAAPTSLDRVSQKWTGDLAEMIELGRPVRVLVSYNQTNFFVSQGVMRGLEVDLMNAYSRYLAKQSPGKKVRMVFLAVPFSQLIPSLLDGRGDVVAAGMTMTRDRQKIVAFSSPYRKDIQEIVVGGYRSPLVSSLDDLAGKRVHAMAGSSYVEHLQRVSKDLEARGLSAIDVVETDPDLVTEDLLEMVSRGLIEYVVAENQLAEIWKKTMPGLRLFYEAVLHEGGDLAWAVRPGNTELKASLDGFAKTVRQGTLKGNMFYKRYLVNEQHVLNFKNPLEQGRLHPMAELFRKYAARYGFDWLKIAALAFQESGFDQRLRSRRGAVGVMQIKPSTASDPNVGITDIEELENNIHAGVKYLHFLCEKYFKNLAPESRVDFALAAYNAGPGRVRTFRKRAVAMGLDPDRWFGNVEWAAYDIVGHETPDYVAHVQMYYAAYLSMAEVLNRRDSVVEP
ncbi:transporter substrate-binding domain-containing protein [Pseudodesulfovibrio sp. JC047]|uniref:transglycosylase SLT domain-containing protein n=1 Tax=Pseudodesulfovibrio sp. JC047 TaxID=2683199 RepID=UPI0013CFE37C|nr:transporter substrate-binding domain-containing protein [Pseudodesulfovibrio sp. JC047]NDV20665.1 transporter substrate-binding domain-containing protein [Pseudodesulfovibrio sp. JC047]